MIKNSKRFNDIFEVLSQIDGCTEEEFLIKTLSYKMPNNVKNETILHAWNWSLDAVKEKLFEIKEAGYTAVQISPVQGTKNDANNILDWWILYQPTNFKIGNTQIGSKEELIELCQAAEKLNIKIIVDVIVNHTASRGGGDDSYYPDISVDPILRDNENYWHEHRAVENWNDRWQVTHLAIGLPDLNTENEELQDIIIEFLNELIECGVRGFRFDAAKHIELPNDPGGSNFWPRVLGSLINREKLIIYGEVLQCGASNYESYADYMGLSAEGYAYSLRCAVGYKSNTNVQYAIDYCVPKKVMPSDLVTWVESHDDYAGDRLETVNLSNWQIKMAWAIIAARKQSSPMFFNRPISSTSGKGIIGTSGDEFWRDNDIKEINKFRNKMIYEDERLIPEEKKMLMIERGNKGLIIINLGEKIKINWSTDIDSGIYIDRIKGQEFIVSSGKVKGTIEQGNIAILYDPKSLDESFVDEKEEGKIYFHKPHEWRKPKIYLYFGNNILKPWPGDDMISEGKGIYSYVLPEDWEKGYVIFSDGINQIPHMNNSGLAIVKKETKEYVNGYWKNR